ncbi:TraY domain-containing protein [Bradyrhizobium murdochi]|uniref:TraY domain-containing protein n=1 Tax=Bradyrhizobium murdochi TaxID=1038859 RepID=UPI00042858B4|nr:TraY domain-containing protein [Bradyrhizobium murdochi]
MARKTKTKDTHTPHLRLRVEPSLLARLEKSAEKNGRTLTGEIVDRLEASFKRDDMQSYVDATAQRFEVKWLEAHAEIARLTELAKILRDRLEPVVARRAKKGDEQ